MNTKVVLLIMLVIVFLAYQFIVRPFIDGESEVYAETFNIYDGNQA